MRIIKTWEFEIADEYQVRDDLREKFGINSLESLLDAAASVSEFHEVVQIKMFLNKASDGQVGWDDDPWNPLYEVTLKMMEHTVRLEK